jgi:hypothetical protein
VKVTIIARERSWVARCVRRLGVLERCQGALEKDDITADVRARRKDL